MEGLGVHNTVTQTYMMKIMTPTLQQLMAHELIMLCPIHEEENDPNSQSTALELTIL